MNRDLYAEFFLHAKYVYTHIEPFVALRGYRQKFTLYSVHKIVNHARFCVKKRSIRTTTTHTHILSKKCISECSSLPFPHVKAFNNKALRIARIQNGTSIYFENSFVDFYRFEGQIECVCVCVCFEATQSF